MKIKALNIASFGGLKNLKLDLSDDFNIIYGGNENGKTTVMSFIKMMFYGSERGSSQISKNPRKKYTPWDGSPMAGSIDFEHNGRNYRLEREFRSSNSTDKVTLCDLDLGERQNVSSDIGTQLFGLSAAAFERSVFIGQFGFPESNSSAEGELNSKLSNIALTGDESISFEEVNTRLEKAKLSLMSKSGRAGAYDKNVSLSADLNKSLEAAENAQHQISLAKEKITAEIEKQKALQAKADALKSSIDREQDFRNAEKLRELLKLKSELDKLNDTLRLSGGGLVDEMFVRKVQFCISKVDGITQKYEVLASKTEVLAKSIELSSSDQVTPEKVERLEALVSKLEKERSEIINAYSSTENEYNLLCNDTETPKAKKAVNLPLIIIAVIVALTVFLPMLPTAVKLGAGAAAVVMLILAFVLRPADKVKIEAHSRRLSELRARLVDLKLKENELLSGLSGEKANLTVLKTALTGNKAALEKQKEMLAQNEAELSALEKEKTLEQSTLFELFARYKSVTDINEIKSELEKISRKAAVQKEIKQNINYILKDVGNISYEQAEERLANIKEIPENDTDFEAIKAEYDATVAQITEIKTHIAALNADMKTLSANSENPESIKQKLSVLEAETASQKEFCEALDIALEALQQSFIEVRRSYGSALEKKASDIFSGITGGRYQNMSISKSFDINVEQRDTFGGKELDYLSSGTADQAYLSLRLALLELIDGGLPVLMDDSLAQFDDKRTETALAFLKEYSQNGQIIIFTCHNSVADVAKKLGAKSITL